MRTCRLLTLGCKVNQYETQLVQETLLRNGFRIADETEPANLCIVNTCTVTSMGDSKSRQIIRKLARKNPGTQTIVMGCYATRDPRTVSQLPGVFEVVTDKRELPDVFQRLGIVDLPTGISHFEGRKRAYVKVQDGCILRCTYCIIPKVRPGLQSRSPNDIEQEVRQLIDNGYKEIVLCGIHVGHYGVESTREKSGKKPFRLWDLFRQLDRIPGNWRMRLSSIEAGEINEDFLSAAKDCEHLCPQFHPAMQSGSDGVLRRMRRRYSIGKFLEKIERMKTRIPGVALTTDVIIGFPGETEEEFQETCRSCKEAEFMKMHIFPFSAREGTKAFDFPHQIPPQVKKDRCQRLSLLERELAQKYYARLVNRPLEVMVEQKSPENPGWYRGTDRSYAPVELPAEEAEIGEFVSAWGGEVFGNYIVGTRQTANSLVDSVRI